MTTLTIGFGRNVGTGEPLGPEDWSAFQHGMEQTAIYFGDLLFSGAGRGIYQGVPEDAATVVVETDQPETAIARFAHVARIFGQEAIAVNDSPATVLAIAS